MERTLNLDIAGKVSEFEMLMKKVLPKNIIYQVVLGKGLEFDGYRDYTENDDASLIDWKATVRVGKSLVRKYIEERDLKFIFLIDASDNMVFGSTDKLKCEYAAEMIAAMSHLILTNGDRVGYAMYNGEVVKMRPPELGNRQFEILVDNLSNPLNYGGESNLTRVLSGLIDTLPKDTSMIFIVSDFINVDKSCEKLLGSLTSLFETAAIIVRDPLDNSLPEVNKEIVIENPGTGEKLLINPKLAKNLYEKNAREQLNNLKDVFKNSNIDFLELSTKEEFSTEVASFLEERVKGGRVVKIKNVY